LKSYKSPGTDNIPAELIKVGCGNVKFWDTQTYLFYMEWGIATAVEGIYYYTNS
jgi:hypothetical protein